MFVKQLNQKLNYFTVSVKRGGKKQRKTSDARLKDRASLIFYLNTFFDIVNLAAVPGEESMSNILSSGNENNADKTFSFSADLSWSSYPYKIWTKNGEDQTVYYGDWIDWKKLQ